MLGKGVVNPSVRVLQEATIWFSPDPSRQIAVVMVDIVPDLGIGQQFTFSVVPPAVP